MNNAQLIHDIWVDGGNTEGLLQEVKYAYSWDTYQLYADLISKSPYLSDSVLLATIYQTNVLPDIMVKYILIANPQSLNNMQLSGAIYDYRYDMFSSFAEEESYISDTVSPRQQLEANITYYTMERKTYVNLLKQYYLADHKGDSVDGLIELLAGEPDINSQYELAFIYISKNDQQSLSDVMSAIPLMINPNDQAELDRYSMMSQLIPIIYNPDHSVELITYEWASGNDPTNAMYKVTVSNTNTVDASIKGNPDVVTYYDALNRSVQTQSVSLNGETISSKVTYNAKGQVAQASLPYFENTTPKYTTFAYDYLGRKTQQIIPDGTGGTAGTTTNIDYSDWVDGILTTTVVSGKNSQSQTNITKTNALGQVVSVENDNNNNKIFYAYDMLGRLSDTWIGETGPPYNLSTNLAPANHTAMEYNFHGKRKMLDDQSLGIITSTYDAYDQLRSENNGRDTITNYSYDNFGRVIERNVIPLGNTSNKLETTTYTYENTNQPIKGKLLFVNTAWNNTFSINGSVTDTYYYNDVLGRVTSITKSLDGEVSFSENYSYDAYNRLDVLTYPGSNLIIKQTYKNGQLYQVKKLDGSNSTTIWEAEAKDNFGNITQYNLGNGLQTTKTYDNNTGMLTQINTGTSSSQTSIQNLQYQYDDLYNITSWS